MQYAIFPMKVLRFSSITTGAHAKSRNGSPSDKPIDLVGRDGGRDWFYAPYDLVVLRVYGKASHAVWLRSVDKVHTPSGEKYVYMMVEHMSVSGLKAGRTYKQGAKMFTEHKYGNATGNHLHVSVGISDNKISNIGSGWRRNSRKAWVLYIPGVTNVEINKALYIDKAFTTSVLDKRVTFIEKPNGKMPTISYKVNTNGSNLLVRVAPDKGAAIVGRLAKGTIIEVDERKDDNGYKYITKPLTGYISALWVKKV